MITASHLLTHGDSVLAAQSANQLPVGELILRLIAAVGLTGIIGLEREVRDQAAGLRTHALVGAGAALFTVISAHGFGEVVGDTGVVLDPSRIAAQIASGIGFLGGGAILRYGLSVRGMATAGALWIAAAIGMASGAGYYAAAAATTALVLLALVLFRVLRAPLVDRLRTDYAQLEIWLGPDVRAADVRETVAETGMRSQSLEVDADRDETTIRLDVRVPPGVDIDRALSRLRERDEIHRVRLSGIRTS